MIEPEILKNQEIAASLAQAQQCSTDLNMSFLVSGKWKTAKAAISDIQESILAVSAKNPAKVNCAALLKEEQPVGFSFEIEHFKYIFESKVLNCSCEKGVVSLEMPEKIEKLPRRSYSRVPTPASIAVKVMFWHRGYDDEKGLIPDEDHWQGRLINLSAGGMLIRISAEKQCHFEPGQLVGLQFTPMPYEKPVLLEGLVIHIHPDQEKGYISLGIEFLGLEAGWQGRKKLHRLAEITEQYANIK